LKRGERGGGQVAERWEEMIRFGAWYDLRFGNTREVALAVGREGSYKFRTPRKVKIILRRRGMGGVEVTRTRACL
jgi:hypothetical protein